MRFDGWILGLGTTSGTRLVVGHWPPSPLGAVSDVMVERPDVQVGRVGGRWAVDAGPPALRVRVGRRPALGWLLRTVPSPLARTPAWVGLLDPVARLAMGVRTRGSAGNGRTEWYGVQDLPALRSSSATWDDPPVRFGFGSVPPTPSVVRVTTTIGLSTPV